MKNKIVNEKASALIPPLLSVLIGILLGWLILWFTDPKDAFAGIGTVLSGGFNEGIGGIGSVFYAAAPVILTGLAVGFGMKTGLFNIGASGQFTAGALAAIFAGVRFTALPAGLHTLFAVLCGILAGALWGAVSGALKAYFRVNEVISGIMMNYIMMLFSNIVIKSFLYDEAYNRSLPVAPTAEISKDLLDFLLPGSHVSVIIFAALAAAVLVKLVMDRTVFGYELKTTGRNPYAAEAAGINTKKCTALTLAIAGALAGLGGALMFLSDFGDHITVGETVLQQGYTGISVALLGMSEPFGIVLAGLFIAYITVGGSYLQLYGYTPDAVDMMVAVIIFCGAFVVPIRQFIRAKLRRLRHIPEEGRV